MNQYPYIVFFQRFGAALSVGVAAVVLLVCVLLIQGLWSAYILSAVAVGVALMIWLLLRVFAEIATLLSETLIPKL